MESEGASPLGDAEAIEDEDALHRRRRPLDAAADRWAAVDQLSEAGHGLRQRFRPPKLERRVCWRFLSEEGCPFGERCTHLHPDAESGRDVRDSCSSPADGGVPPDGAADRQRAPRVCLHKMEDRKVGRGSVSLLLRTLETGGFGADPVPPEEADLLLANAFPSPPLLAKLRPGCTVNHFPGEQEIGAKDRLARLLRGLGLAPASFVLPEGARGLRAAAEAAGPGRLWIAKPRQLGGGRHVRVLRGAHGLQAAGILGGEPCVVSEYVADPLLVEGRKVDLRVYALVTQLEPRLEAFVFREGLVRVCGEAYDLTDEGLRRPSGHISNNAVQTRSQRHACAANWTLAEFRAWLDAGGGPSASAVWRRALRAVSGTLEAWRPAARAAAARAGAAEGLRRVRCYSLLAFDLLVDRRGRCWVLEVNPKPALHAQSASLKAAFPVHFTVKAALLADMFSLVGLPEEHRGDLGPVDRGDSLGFVPLPPLAASPEPVLAVARNWGGVAGFLQQRCRSSALVACPSWLDAHERGGFPG